MSVQLLGVEYTYTFPGSNFNTFVIDLEGNEKHGIKKRL